MLYPRTLLLALLVAVFGCTTKPGAPTIPLTPYHVTMTLGGTLPLTEDLGVVKLPEGAVGLVNLGVQLGEPILLAKVQAKACTFAAPTNPTPTAGALVASVTATCTVQGMPVQETLTFTFTPVPAA
jgi:hypothetical protein